MKTLVIYDDSGYVLITQSGSYRIPEGGVQYLEVEIPTDKRLISIDTTKSPHVPIYEEIEPSEIEILKKRQEEQEAALIELAAMLGGEQ